MDLAQLSQVDNALLQACLEGNEDALDAIAILDGGQGHLRRGVLLDIIDDGCHGSELGRARLRITICASGVYRAGAMRRVLSGYRQRAVGTHAVEQ